MVRRKGQSPEVQAERLADGCCPVHGGPLQRGVTYYPISGPDFVLMECERGDCDIRVIERAGEGEAEYEWIDDDWQPPRGWWQYPDCRDAYRLGYQEGYAAATK